MNNKDKEAFDKWITKEVESGNWKIAMRDSFESWQAACEYKQKEIDEILGENAKLKDALLEISQETRVIEGVECSTNGAVIAAEMLKELDEKL